MSVNRRRKHVNDQIQLNTHNKIIAQERRETHNTIAIEQT